MDCQVINNLNAQTIHPAYIMDFDDLYKGLNIEVNNGNVYRQVQDDLELFNYSPQCTFSKSWNQYTLISRGLILCPNKKKIVAAPFPKFFNYGEVALTLPDLPFTVLDKMDGSMAIIYHWDGRWHVATRGSFNSDQAQAAEKYLYDRMPFYKDAIPGTTYIAEWISPTNRIVVPYDHDALVLLAYYGPGGYEVPVNNAFELASHLGFEAPNAHNYTNLNDMLEICKTLPPDKEGFVVRFANGFRVKIKGDEYCRIHALVSNCTPLAVWESMKNGDDLFVIKQQLPEEFAKDFEKIVFILSSHIDALHSRICTLHRNTMHLTDKEVGLKINAGEYGELGRWIFPCRKKNFMFDVWKPGPLRNGFFETFRPTANKLNGYTPTSAMNRFTEEVG